MTDAAVRVSEQWLRLREPADAAARSRDLVHSLVPHLGSRSSLVVHDLGCGSGSLGRWLAPLLPGPQHWVLHDRDRDLLDLAGGDPPAPAADGSPVTVETREGDLTRLRPELLTDASLVTASAVLDMLTAQELDDLVRCSVAAACPVLITISVVGRVELDPADPLDARVGAAFNDHQRRTTSGRRLQGPDAAGRTVAGLRARGHHVLTAPSPWRLGPHHRDLMDEWLAGWVGAACEQRPGLTEAARAYLARRRAALAAGRLSVTVHHIDLMAVPPAVSR
jgi:hypothetical protein